MPLDMMGSAGSSRMFDLTARPLPRQNTEAVLLHAGRMMRAQAGMEEWAKIATQCVDYFEGRQWTADDLRKLRDEGRPSLTINGILPLVNLVLGYHINTRTEGGYLPGHDGSGTAEIAAALTAVGKFIDERNDVSFVSSEVFLDGLLTGRGYFESRIDFSKNALGEPRVRAVDPFSVYHDPDAFSYDPNEGNYLIKSRWVSTEEVRCHYGEEAEHWVSPLLGGRGGGGLLPVGYGLDMPEITPWRNFGGDQYDRGVWGSFTDQIFDWVDKQRKVVRLLDIEHWVMTDRWFFVDMETGDQKPVPDAWDRQKIERVMLWAAENRVPLVVQKKMTRRLRWTHMVADVVVFDEWSPYDSMTITPYYPYFRRGMTKGMVEPLVDPQRERNVRRSARLNIIGRSSNGGWMVPEGGLSPEQSDNLERNGGRPGLVMKYRTTAPNGSSLPPPQQISPAQSPVSIAQLEAEAKDDLMEIAGINPSALGQDDKSNISGRTVLARQQGTVIGLEGFMSNYHRTIRMLAARKLELIQGFMTEPRIIRVIGSGGNPMQVEINQKTAAGIVNDLSLGRYAVRVDETSLTESFLAGQFHELLEMKAAGIPMPDEFIIDASSIGRKEELRAQIAALREQMAAAGVPARDDPASAGTGPGPGGSMTGPDGGSLPAG